MSLPVEPETLLRHTDWLRALALELLGDPQRAEDVVQDTWVAALEHPPRSSQDGPRLRGWLKRVATNFARMSARSEERRGRRERIGARDEASPGVAESVERFGMHREVVTAVQALPSPEREIVVLRYFEGEAPRRIAERLGLSPGAVRTRLSRALAKLRSSLDETHGGDRRAWAGVLAGWVDLSGASVTPFWKAIAGGLLMKLSFQVGAALAAALLLTFGLLRLRSEPVSSEGRGEGAAAEMPALVEASGATGERSSLEQEDHRVALESTEREADGEARAAALVLVVEGRCVDAAGRPLSGVRASARRSTETEAVPGKSEIVSGGDGQFVLEIGWQGSQAGESWVWVDFSREGLADGWARAKVTGPGRVHLPDVQMGAGGTVEGRVVDSRGNPLAGIRVFASHAVPEDDHSARAALRAFGGRSLGSSVGFTGPDGRYRMTGVPATHLCLTAREPDGLVGATPRLAVPAGGVLRAPDIVIEPTTPEDTVAGRVLGPGGVPVGGILVTLRDELEGRNCYSRWASAEDGGFRAIVARGRTYRVEAEDRRGRWQRVQASGVEPGEQDLVLRFPRESWIEVHVRAPDGAPVESFEVIESYRDERGPLLRAEAVQAGEVRALVPTHPFHVGLRAAGFVFARQGPFDPANLPARIVFDLEHAGSLEGRVLAGGAPVEGARVHAHPLARGGEIGHFGEYLYTRVVNERFSVVETGADGAYSLSIEKAGEYLVHAELEGFARAEVGPIDLGAGQQLSSIDLELKAGGQLAGRFLVAEGVSPSGWIVAVTSADGHAYSQTVGSDGEYRFEELAAGDWQVRRIDTNRLHFLTVGSWRPLPEGAIPEWSVQVAQGSTAQCDLDLRAAQPCRVRGRILLDGRVPPATRFAFGGKQATVHAQLDSKGDYEVVLPTPGTYQLSLSHELRNGVRTSLHERRTIRVGETIWNIELPAGTVELQGLEVPGHVDRRGLSSRPPFFIEWEGTAGVAWSAKIWAADAGVLRLPLVPSGELKLLRSGERGAEGTVWGEPAVLEFSLGGGEEKLVRAPD